MRQANAAALRRELRGFLAAEIAAGGFDPAAGSWAAPDPGFAARLGARGYIGTCWPRALGGQGGSAADRHIIAEELLAHGAPLRAHWVAEWLVGPLLLAAGTPGQQAELLPRLATGRLSACIGLTEAALPGDATLRCRARPAPGGWRLTGRCHVIGEAGGRMLLLARTGDGEGPGLSLFLLDLALPGLVPQGAGRLALEEVFLAEDRLLGPAEEGLALWAEAAAVARAAPDGWLRHLPLLAALAGADAPPEADPVLGRLVAACATLHSMGLSRAGRPSCRLATLAALEAGAPLAALRRLLPEEARPRLAEPPPLIPLPALRRPAQAVRPAMRPPGRLVAETVRLLAGTGTAPGFDLDCWTALEEGPVLRAALPPELDGEGLGLPGLLAIVEAAGAAAAPLPVAETLLGHHALARAGLAPPLGPLTIGPVTGGEAPRLLGGLLAGQLRRLPWARHAAAAVLVLEDEEGPRTILAGRPAIGATGTNGAGEPRDLVLLEEMPVLAAGPPGQGLTPAGLRDLGALFRAAAMLGAIGVLARGAASRALAAMARHAVRRAARDPGRFAIACARLRVAAAAEACLAAPGRDPALARRLAAWGGEFGTESATATWLGGEARRAGAAGLWPLIVDRGRMPGETEDTAHE
ncbi:acyl-CoA dehydrogenase family protein [Belnapia rosea]|uniref:acyl-CoA dehydrogenase family protein n=1 Tax=Belnapia rosea TaxID=938405 RepID=UPI0008897C6D|nr:acyl-CoA dehydrogenase family protein [Belnapia rosea]SDB10759.1 Acyl-CoA dehydrogenase, N-terminal domain [Belnapia rosea]